MSDDGMVTVTISAKALDSAHLLVKLAGYDVSDRRAVEGVIDAQVQATFRAAAEGIAKRGVAADTRLRDLHERLLKEWDGVDSEYKAELDALALVADMLLGPAQSVTIN